MEDVLCCLRDTLCDGVYRLRNAANGACSSPRLGRIEGWAVGVGHGLDVLRRGRSRAVEMNDQQLSDCEAYESEVVDNAMLKQDACFGSRPSMLGSYIFSGRQI